MCSSAPAAAPHLDMRRACTHVCHMSKMVQIRDVRMAVASRRHFLQLGGAITAIGAAVPTLRGAQGPGAAKSVAAAHDDDRVVRLSGDGLGLTTAQYTRELARLAEGTNIAPDAYSIAGVVEQLEAEFAAILGKERAVFMPTGTLANHWRCVRWPDGAEPGDRPGGEPSVSGRGRLRADAQRPDADAAGGRARDVHGRRVKR